MSTSSGASGRRLGPIVAFRMAPADLQRLDELADRVSMPRGSLARVLVLAALRRPSEPGFTTGGDNDNQEARPGLFTIL